jgi:hypothetical protein
MALALAAVAAFLVADGRGQTFWFDEWAFLLDRQGNGAATYLEPHNGHFSLVPIAVYKLLLELAGMARYWPYQLVVIAVHLICATLVYLYGERRVGGWLAAGVTVPLLFLGPAWQVIIWPFELAWVTSLAAGLGALMLLDRGRRGDLVGASLLLCVSIASSGLGVAVLLGVAVDTALHSERRRRLWTLAPPAGLYVAWYLAYGEPNFALHRIARVPGFVADALAASVSSLVGLSGQTIPDVGASLEWGRPLAVVAVALLVWRLVSLGGPSRRVAALLATIVGFWVLTAVSRAGVQVAGYALAPAYSSRYIYVGGFFLTLVAMELLRGVRVSRTAALVLVASLTMGVIAHAGAFRDANRYLRDAAAILTSNLGAIEMTRDLVAPEYEAGPYAAAGPFLALSADHGSPARSPAQLAAASESAREGTDFALTQIHRVAATPPGGARPGGPPPRVEQTSAGSIRSKGSCTYLRATGYHALGVTTSVATTLPPAGLLVTARGGAVELAVRRFADQFPRRSLGVIRDGSTALLRIPADRDPRAWHLEVRPEARARVCSVAG